MDELSGSFPGWLWGVLALLSFQESQGASAAWSRERNNSCQDPRFPTSLSAATEPFEALDSNIRALREEVPGRPLLLFWVLRFFRIFIVWLVLDCPVISVAHLQCLIVSCVQHQMST
jgi:hypothetical protein